MLLRIYAANAARNEREAICEPYARLRERALARKSERRPFLAALQRGRRPAVVAEIKRASPSAGTIVANFDPVAIARGYDRAGAAAISVLTERDFFGGDLAHLDRVRRVTHVPILRKDFLWTRYHIAQTAAYGADCALLIVAGIDDPALRACLDEAHDYGLDVLVETRTEFEVSRALGAGATLIGVNNRDLRTMKVNLATTERLMPRIPAETFAVSESGILNEHDMRRVRKAGAGAVLIGEALMRAQDPAAFLRRARA